MGNCLKVPREDHQSLLREISSLEPIDNELPPPPAYHNGTANTSFNINHNTNSTLSEEEEEKLAKKLGFIHHLPSGTYNGMKKHTECVICMIDFCIGDSIRYLPCMHIYHKECIDDWLLRSFTCPTCMEPVDAALISTFYTSE